jgi:hypothetical protein
MMPRNYLQQVRNWNYLYQKQLVTIPTTGLDVSLAVNGAFKHIDYIYEANDDGTEGCRVDYITHKSAHDIFENISEYWNDVYRIGKKIYVAGATTSKDYILVGYQWLPDYDGSNTSDVFTEYASNFLKLYAINLLQLFQKEDTRSYISQSRVDKAYEGLLIWDGEISSTKQQLDLE